MNYGDFQNYIKKSTDSLSLLEMLEFTDRFNSRKTKIWPVYLFWLIGGCFGLHRLYLGQVQSFLGFLSITILTLGFGGIFGIIDVINIPNNVRLKNKDLVIKIIKEIKDND